MVLWGLGMVIGVFWSLETQMGGFNHDKKNEFLQFFVLKAGNSPK